MTLIAHTLAWKIEKRDNWILANGRKFGFIHPDRNAIIVHRPRVEVLAREFGFYVPIPLLRCLITFEVQLKPGVYHHWHFNPALPARLVRSDNDYFVSTARMIHNPNSIHIPRPRMPC